MRIPYKLSGDLGACQIQTMCEKALDVAGEVGLLVQSDAALGLLASQQGMTII